MQVTAESLRQALFSSWSKATSSKYTPDNPARGQCGVTTLVVQDFLGGEILKTPLKEGWHFYNRLEGKRMDFTASQFEKEIDYRDVTSGREEAFRDTNEEPYRILREAVSVRLKRNDE